MDRLGRQLTSEALFEVIWVLRMVTALTEMWTETKRDDARAMMRGGSHVAPLPGLLGGPARFAQPPGPYQLLGHPPGKAPSKGSLTVVTQDSADARSAAARCHSVRRRCASARDDPAHSSTRRRGAYRRSGGARSWQSRSWRRWRRRPQRARPSSWLSSGCSPPPRARSPTPRHAPS